MQDALQQLAIVEHAVQLYLISEFLKGQNEIQVQHDLSDLSDLKDVNEIHEMQLL